MAKFKKSDKTEALKRIPIFSDLSKKELGFLAQLTTEMVFREGTDLVKQGEMGREAMMLMSGTATVRRNGRKIAELSSGDVLGEMSLINRAPRNATVTASSEVTVFLMNSREFSSVVATNDGLAAKMLKSVAARLVENQTNAI